MKFGPYMHLSKVTQFFFKLRLYEIFPSNYANELLGSYITCIFTMYYWFGKSPDDLPSGHLTLEQCWNVLEITSWCCSKLNFNVDPMYSACRVISSLFSDLYLLLNDLCWTHFDHLLKTDARIGCKFGLDVSWVDPDQICLIPGCYPYF